MHSLYRSQFPRFRHGNRGVILLLVLSLLTLFMLLAATMLVIANRARLASQAFQRAEHWKETLATHGNTRGYLDSVLMHLLRDRDDHDARSLYSERWRAMDAAARKAGQPFRIDGEWNDMWALWGDWWTGSVSDLYAQGSPFESLLGDLYGLRSVAATASEIILHPTSAGVPNFGPLTALIEPVERQAWVGDLWADKDVNKSGPFHDWVDYPHELCGRVISFMHPDNSVTSHRILSAVATGDWVDWDHRDPPPDARWSGPRRVRIAATPPLVPRAFPQVCRVIINGRDYSGQAGLPETWSADWRNPARGGLPPSVHRGDFQSWGITRNKLPFQTNEAWDGYDEHNVFLARIEPDPQDSTRANADTLRPSFFNSQSFSIGGAGMASIPAGDDEIKEGGLPMNPGLRSDDAWDNDGDGVLDSVFVDFFGDFWRGFHWYNYGVDPMMDGRCPTAGLPRATTRGGNYVERAAAVMIVPLDGRFNVNAHGSFIPLVFHSRHTGWNTAIPGLTDLQTIPAGSGYGPAEINPFHPRPLGPSDPPGAMRLFGDVALQGTENPIAHLMLGSTLLQGRWPVGARYDGSVSATTGISRAEGRYGDFADTGVWRSQFDIGLSSSTPPRPGRPNQIESVAAMRSRRSYDVNRDHGVPRNWFTDSGARGIYNSPPDLHGMMKTTTIPADRLTEDNAAGFAIAPRLVFAKPDWTDAIMSDPYGARVIAEGYSYPQANNSAANRLDSPFGVGELEAVLRPYDADTKTLPQRLVSLLGSAAETARTQVTSRAYDTTMLVGNGWEAPDDAGGSRVAEGAFTRIAKYLKAVAGPTYNPSDDPDRTPRPVSFPGGSPALRDPRFPTTPSALVGAIANELARGEKLNLDRVLYPQPPPQYDHAHPYYVTRQAFFKDLYTLAAALSPVPADADASARTQHFRTLAQWAANAVDFCDADSRHTPFEYDVNPYNGWDVDGNVTTSQDDADSQELDRDIVWGAERPEILIVETSAEEDDTGGRLFFSLHRPWDARGYSTANMIAAEPNSSELDVDQNSPTNIVDLEKLTPGEYPLPVWRCRLETPNASDRGYVCFNSQGTGSAQGPDSQAFRPSGIGPQNAARLGAIGWLFVGTESATSAPAPSDPPFLATTRINISQLRIPGAPASISPAAPSWPVPRDCTVVLERLSNPSVDLLTEEERTRVWTSQTRKTDTTRYIVVDQAPVRVVNRRDPPPGFSGDAANRNFRKLTRQTDDDRALWATDKGPRAYDAAASRFNETVEPSIQAIRFTKPPAGQTAWFHWPNRPLLSPVELWLVPTAGPGQLGAPVPPGPASDDHPLLTGYERLRINRVGIPTAVAKALSLLPDAAYVPTRFARTHTTLTETMPQITPGTGIDQDVTPIHQFSMYREPGRININTIPSDQIWDAVVAGPLSTAPDDRTRDRIGLFAKPARSLAEALQLAVPGSPSTEEPRPLADENNSGLPVRGPGGAIEPNPLHSIYTANRLANTVTVRSSVFAIWITARFRVFGYPESATYHRAFAIIDRSIPVAFEPGRDHNVRDTILLWRIIE